MCTKRETFPVCFQQNNKEERKKKKKRQTKKAFIQIQDKETKETFNKKKKIKEIN